MLKKLFIIPWFGDYPEWWKKYDKHIEHLSKYGYDFYFSRIEDEFIRRSQKAIGLTPIVKPGTSLVHNYRTAYGLMYADMLKDYDFWGITDLDCVYGKIDSFMTDNELENIDIWSNHHNYICGPWTLFRNTEKINNLFRLVPNWEHFMNNTELHPGRWTEVEYSQKVDELHKKGEIYREYTFFQGKNPNITENLSFQEGKLYDGEDEIMTFHFNRTKIWPL